MLRTVLLILSGNASSSILLFARNLLVARLLEVDDYGIASAFALAMTAIEMATSVGLSEFVVQNRRGDDEELLAGVHSFSVLRGLLSTLVLFFAAGPLSNFFEIDHVAWAFRLLALTALIRGFEHFDPWRFSRGLNFRPLMYIRVGSAFASILVVGPLYFLFGDYRLSIGAIFVHVGVSLILSHSHAERRYRLSLRDGVFLEILSFGWPILINSFLLFLVFQGDRVIVGRFFDIADFALFSMAVTLILTPSLIIAGSEQQYFLSLLSSKRDDKGVFPDLACAVVQASFVSSLILFFVLVILMPITVVVLLGVKYEPLIPFIVPLAVQFSVRNLKVGCTTASISLGRTGNAVVSNLARLLFFPISWLVIERGGSLIELVWLSTIGEILGFFVSIVLLVRHANVPAKAILRSAVWALVVFGQSCLYYTHGGRLFFLGIVLSTVATFYYSYEFRRLIFAQLWRPRHVK